MGLNESLQKARNELYQNVWRTFHDRSQNPPPVLYHYTSAEGLKGILESGDVWATHMFYLNDPLEMRYGQELFRKVISAARRQSSGPRRDFLEKCSETFEEVMRDERSLPAGFCACFSAKADDLGQYRAYAGGGIGYCLGFGTQEMRDNLGRFPYAGSGRLFELIVMDYDEQQQKTKMAELIDSSASAAETLLNDFGTADQATVYRQLASTCLDNALRLCTYFKHPSFRDEAEWRIVPTPFGAPLAIPLDPYRATRVRDGLFVPYLEIPLSNDKDILTPLKEIYIGPKLAFEPAELGLLSLSAYQEVDKSGVLVEIKRSSTILQ